MGLTVQIMQEAPEIHRTFARTGVAVLARAADDVILSAAEAAARDRPALALASLPEAPSGNGLPGTMRAGLRDRVKVNRPMASPPDPEAPSS